jgi:rubrerythrin
MASMTDESSAGPSPWERDLYAHLTTHVEAERELLQRYSTIAEKTESEAFRYLVQLLVEDEIRHHGLFQDLAESLKNEAILARKPVIPDLDFDRADGQGIQEATRQLLQSEERDARELKRLQRDLRDVKDTSLWSLLVDLMERDTQKHIAIVEFVRRHARAR